MSPTPKKRALRVDGGPERLDRTARRPSRHDHTQSHPRLADRSTLFTAAYADHLLGRVLDHMDDTGLWDSTTLVLWSDHGYQLGEKLAFHKFTPWERSLCLPVMVAGPDIDAGLINEPVSLVDLAPTLMTLAGQPTPE